MTMPKQTVKSDQSAERSRLSMNLRGSRVSILVHVTDRNSITNRLAFSEKNTALKVWAVTLYSYILFSFNDVKNRVNVFKTAAVQGVK